MTPTRGEAGSIWGLAPLKAQANEKLLCSIRGPTHDYGKTSRTQPSEEHRG